MDRYVQAFWNGKFHKIDTLTDTIIWARDYPWQYPKPATPEYVTLVITTSIKRREHIMDIESALWM